MSGIYPYQGGIDQLHTRASPRQRGSGFLSGLKRFLIPLAKVALPHVAGAVADIVGGRGAVETLKSRGREAGADLIEKAGRNASELIRNDSEPAAKPKKRRATPPTKSVSKRKKVNTTPQKRKRGWN